jgi:hypothetical protein
MFMTQKVRSTAVTNLSTGPKTVAGKKASSKNAQKAAIFSQGYLSWEDKDAKQLQMEALAIQWGADDPSRQLILRGIEQANLSLERMMNAERKMLEGKMQSLDIAQQFVSQAGRSAIEAMNIPSWYFKEDDHNKKFAPYILDVCSEAVLLRDQYSDRLSGELAKHFPNLAQYIMEGQKQGNSVLVSLGLRYKMSTPLLNLNALISEVKANYSHHLMWAKDAQRYEIIIDGIRAKAMLEAMDLDKSSRYATAFQNRILKGFQAMAAMDQLEHAKALLEQERTNTVAATVATATKSRLPSPSKKVAKEGLVIDEEQAPEFDGVDELEDYEEPEELVDPK